MPRVGIAVDTNAGSALVVDLSRLPDAPFDTTSMLALIEAGASAMSWLREAESRRDIGVPLAAVKLFAPIPRPKKNVFCVGWNYVEHFEEGAATRTQKIELPEHVTFFTKAPTTVNGPFDQILIDASITEKLDWEVELALIISRVGSGIAEADAMSHVFGYTVLNDVTGRDIQRRHGQQWFKGKSLDGSCPMGPWIVTADALDPSALALHCRVNDVDKQRGSTAQMHFKIPRILAELSHGLTLEPGDIIATGTPPGVGHARIPPEFMREGDVLESHIEGIGTIRNRIGSAR
jgi:2-keto-4-pentenoate hydratase/2-oxohepta-3-ene-1,7-dioic acid hydratase in catechol pathway